MRARFINEIVRNPKGSSLGAIGIGRDALLLDTYIKKHGPRYTTYTEIQKVSNIKETMHFSWPKGLLDIVSDILNASLENIKQIGVMDLQLDCKKYMEDEFKNKIETKSETIILSWYGDEIKFNITSNLKLGAIHVYGVWKDWEGESTMDTVFFIYK